MDVMIVDDEPLARERLSRLLARIEGYRVVGVAGNADQAMQALSECDPDIVLCDIRMRPVVMV